MAARFFTALQLTGGDYPFSFRAMSFMWPSSFLLLGTEGVQKSLQAHVIIPIAILLNGLAYFLVSTVICVAIRTSRR